MCDGWFQKTQRGNRWFRVEKANSAKYHELFSAHRADVMTYCKIALRET